LQLNHASGVNPYTWSSTPSSEVTGSVCRVPKRGFSLAPEDFLLAYLCRFAVRVPERLLRGFSRQCSVYDFMGLAAPRFELSGLNDSPDLPGESPYTLNPHFQSWARIASCVPPSYKRLSGSSGILTGHPSATPFGLALGPD
jgi:hypothetical protein